MQGLSWQSVKIYMAFCGMTAKIERNHLQTLKSYFAFSLKHEQKIQPALRSHQ